MPNRPIRPTLIEGDAVAASEAAKVEAPDPFDLARGVPAKKPDNGAGSSPDRIGRRGLPRGLHDDRAQEKTSRMIFTPRERIPRFAYSFASASSCSSSS
jgi:hypothetical protein